MDSFLGLIRFFSAFRHPPLLQRGGETACGMEKLFRQDGMELVPAALHFAQHRSDSRLCLHPVVACQLAAPGRTDEDFGLREKRAVVHERAPGVNRHAAEDGAPDGERSRFRARAGN